MAFFDDILRNLQGQQGPSLGVNTQIPAPVLPPGQPTPQVPAPEVRGAGGGLLGTLGIIASALKGDVGGIVSQLENRKLSQQTQKEKQKKLQTEQNLGQLTGSALGVRQQDLGSPEQLFNAFLQAGASPEDARTSLNFIQGQQEKASGDSDALLAPFAQELAQGLQGPTRNAVEALAKAGKGSKAFAEAQAERGRQITAGERDLRKQEKAVTTKVEAAKQTLKDIPEFEQNQKALAILTGTSREKPLTMGEIFDVDLTDKESIQEFATNRGLNPDQARRSIFALQQTYADKRPGFFGTGSEIALAPSEIATSIGAYNSPEVIAQAEAAKAAISQGAEKKAEIRAYEPKTKKEKEVFNKAKANAKLLSPEQKAKRLKELEALGK